MRKSICILSFSPIHRDARVLRQIKYLSADYDLMVIGYGPPHPTWQGRPGIRWRSIAESRPARLSSLGRLLLLAGPARLYPALYDAWYWSKAHYSQAYAEAVASGADAFHANDWEALPVAAEAARGRGAKLLFDAHEYAPLEFEYSRTWRWLRAPAVRYFLGKYAPAVDVSTTVAPAIAARYRQEFSLDPIVVLNAPDCPAPPAHVPNPDQIRLIHHGVANRDRRLETMIETMAYCRPRYTLDFMFVENDSGYIRFLEKQAAQLAPGRITFRPPLAPEAVVPALSAYDIGFYLLEPTMYNLEVALPNKLFDFIAAGLVVCIGPTPGMAEIVQKYGLGCIAPTFVPNDVARMLNGLDTGQIAAMQAAARAARLHFQAGIEMAKVVELYRKLLA